MLYKHKLIGVKYIISKGLLPNLDTFKNYKSQTSIDTPGPHYYSHEL